MKSVPLGVAVDARLVQSASHPISNEVIKKQRELRNTPAGKLDKNGHLLKYSRDLDSDWVLKKGVALQNPRDGLNIGKGLPVLGQRADKP